MGVEAAQVRRSQWGEIGGVGKMADARHYWLADHRLTSDRAHGMIIDPGFESGPPPPLQESNVSFSSKPCTEEEESREGRSHRTVPASSRYNQRAISHCVWRAYEGQKVRHIPPCPCIRQETLPPSNRNVRYLLRPYADWVYCVGRRAKEWEALGGRCSVLKQPSVFFLVFSPVVFALGVVASLQIGLSAVCIPKWVARARLSCTI